MENSGSNLPDTPKENEIAEYYEGVKEMEMRSYESGIKKARNALYVTAALTLASELISASAMGIIMTPAFIAIVAVETGIFIGLALWTKTKPYTAIVIGLIIFIGLWVLSIVLIGGKAIYSGIIFKAIVIYFLVSALKPAKAWEETKKSM